MYKSYKLLVTSWDGLYDDMLTKQKMILRKKNQDIDNIKRMHANDLLKFECEKNSILNILKNENIKREQNLLDSVTELANNMNRSKSYWANNINDLHLFLQEQNQNMINYQHWRQNKLQKIDNELENLFNSPGEAVNDTLSNPPLSTQRECDSAIAQNRPPLNVNNINSDLIEVTNALSPIHHEENQNNNLNNPSTKVKVARLGFKNVIQYKDDANPSTKRNHLKNDRENIENISVNSSKMYADLSFLNKNDPNFNNMEYPYQEDSKISIKKHQPEWDSTLEDEESLDNALELGKAMDLLHKAHIFDSV